MNITQFTHLSFFCLFILLSNSSIAQEQKKENQIAASLNAELLSNFSWRGLSITQSPTFIPTLMVKNNKFSFGLYGFVDIKGYEELDLELTYKLKDLTFLITDYYASKEKYFNYSQSSSQHLVELGLNFQRENFPLQCYIATMVYGADKHSLFDTISTNQIKQNYSTYMEVKYSLEVNKISLDFYGGLTPFTGIYGNDFAFVNIGIMASKEIQITNSFILPLYASFSINPQKEQLLVFLGIHV